VRRRDPSNEDEGTIHPINRKHSGIDRKTHAKGEEGAQAEGDGDVYLDARVPGIITIMVERVIRVADSAGARIAHVLEGAETAVGGKRRGEKPLVC